MHSGVSQATTHQPARSLTVCAVSLVCCKDAVTEDTPAAAAAAAALTTTSSVVVQSPGGVSLHRRPASVPVMRGDDVSIICRLTDRLHALDIVRLVRRPLAKLTNHSSADVISTNGVVEGRFKVTGRYKVTRWSEPEGLVQLQITGDISTLN